MKKDKDVLELVIFLVLFMILCVVSLRISDEIGRPLGPKVGLLVLALGMIAMGIYAYKEYRQEQAYARERRKVTMFEGKLKESYKKEDEREDYFSQYR